MYTVFFPLTNMQIDALPSTKDEKNLLKQVECNVSLASDRMMNQTTVVWQSDPAQSISPGQHF